MNLSRAKGVLVFIYRMANGVKMSRAKTQNLRYLEDYRMALQTTHRRPNVEHHNNGEAVYA